MCRVFWNWKVFVFVLCVAPAAQANQGALSCAQVFGAAAEASIEELSPRKPVDAAEARRRWLEEEARLNNARAVLVKKYVGSDRNVDKFLRWARRSLLDGSSGRIVKGPVELTTMIGPTGIGKTGLVTDLGELLQIRVEIETPEKGAVQMDLSKLRNMIDQRNPDGRPRILVIDEVQHYKPFRELDRNKRVLIEDRDILEVLGPGAQPLYREVDEAAQRLRSQEYFLQFLGGGRITRKPLMTPEGYRKRIRELTVDYVMNKEIIESMKNELASEKANKAASDANGSTLEGAQRRFRRAAIDLYNLIDQARDDQPELFSNLGRSELRGYDMIPMDLESLSFNQLMTIVKTHPERFADYVDERARKMPQNPTETCYNCHIVITGNPDVFFERIVRNFFGREPTPDELREAVRIFNETGNREELIHWFLQFFDDSQAMRSRLKVNDLDIMLPLSTQNYRSLVRRDIVEQENLFITTLAEMDVHGVKLVYDSSVEEVINAEVVSALAGTRTVGPRIGEVIEPLRTAAISLLAEIKQRNVENGTHEEPPHLLTVSYDQEHRMVRMRARRSTTENGKPRDIEDPRFSMDFEMPRFDANIRATLTQAEKERRARFLSASIVIGTLVHGSVPLDAHLGINRPAEFQGWVLNYENGDHATLQARLFTALSGLVGNHLVKRGALVTDNSWDLETQLLAENIMENIVQEVKTREERFANLNALRRFNAKFNLPLGLVRLFEKNDYKTKSEMLTGTTRRIKNILVNNRRLMRAIHDHLLAHGRISSAEIKGLIERHERNDVTRWQRLKDGLRKLLMPLGPAGLLTPDKIKVAEPGKPYEAPDFLHEEVSLWERIRRALGMSRPGWSAGMR